MRNTFQIGVVAPSSVVAQDELKRGVAWLKSAGWDPVIHPQCKKKDLFFAGAHETRAQAVYEMAMRRDVPVLWSARGGYGAIHLLPYLENWTRMKGAPPKKLAIGFSDSTAILEFVREVWGWSTLHAPMISSAGLRPALPILKPWIERGFRDGPFVVKKKLKPVWVPDAPAASGVLVGGNLSVWAALSGTPHQGFGRDRIVFLEDISETPSRIDRAFAQLVQARSLEGARALVLGTWQDCVDVPPRSGKRPLRATVTMARALKEIFGAWGEQHRVPVWSGLPVGHGPDGFHPIPLGARARIDAAGQLVLEDWDWTGAI